MDAFSRLPLDLRMHHQLVVACHLRLEDATKLRRYGDDLGLKDELILTGEVSDDALRTLYRRCSVFAFPSLYEGLGLPLLEAMHCGAPVIAGANSSQIEVVGEAGILVNASDPLAISRGLNELLANPEIAAEFARKGMIRASTFGWERSASRVLKAIETEVKPRTIRRDPGHSSRRRIAVVAPFRPKKSGISSYIEWLISKLAKTYRIDLYHDSGYVPDLGLRPEGFSCFDYRLFDAHSKHRRYDTILYQMGNSVYHGFLYEMMLKHPGIVTLHDFSLAGFHYWRASESNDPEAVFRREIAQCEGERAPEILEGLPVWRSEIGGVQDAFTRRGIHLNRSVFLAAKHVVLHSPGMVNAIDAELAEKVRVIPHGAWPSPISADLRQKSRATLGLADSDILFGSFGFLSRSKMNVEALQAFAEIPSAQFVFVGQDCENGEAQQAAKSLGIEHRVRFLGHRTDAEFETLIAAVDIGVSLRRPPTYGETSGALLNLLRRGIPTIVSDVGSFADYPDDVVSKVNDCASLINAMRTLVSKPDDCHDLGKRAFQHVAEHHAWPLVAEHYAALIEESTTLRSPPYETIHQKTGVENLGSWQPRATSLCP